MKAEQTPIIDLHTCIQGEGSLVGVPHILVRVSGCNLRCVFGNSLCDTVYSSHYPEKGKFSQFDIEKMVQQNPQITCILLTGGEPSLYPDFIKWMADVFPEHTITVETNGTIYPGPIANRVDLASISPKLSSSTPTKEKVEKLGISLDGWEEKHEKSRTNINSIVQWIRAARATQLKYVISEESDISEVLSQITSIQSIMGCQLDPRSIYLMPAGDTEEKLQKNRVMVADLCVALGFSYSDRIQYVIYGSKREA